MELEMHFSVSMHPNLRILTTSVGMVFTHLVHQNQCETLAEKRVCALIFHSLHVPKSITCFSGVGACSSGLA